MVKHIPSGQRVSVRKIRPGEWLVGFAAGLRLPNGRVADIWTELWIHPDELTMFQEAEGCNGPA